MKYNSTIRILHTLMAALVIIQLMCVSCFALEIEHTWIYVIHKSCGATLFFVVIALILARLFSKKVEYSPKLPSIQLIAAKIVHWGLYICLLGLSTSGMVSSYFNSSPWNYFFVIPFPHSAIADNAIAGQIFSWHPLFTWPLIILLAMHIVAVLHHKFIAKDNILQRMF